MSNLIDYINQFPEELIDDEGISQVFINFYLYFKKLHEKKLISDNTIYFLDTALDFSEPVFDNSDQTKDYLNAKQFQIEQFLIGLKPKYDKISKNLKKTFNIPRSYSYEEIYELIVRSYLAYASLRYKQNLLNTRVYSEVFTIKQQFYKMPKYIPETNANISEFLDIVTGIKSLSMDGKTYDWFNVFNELLNIRVIVDINDGQIVSIFVNGEEYTDVPSSFIRKLKEHIKKGTQPTPINRTIQNK